MERNISSNSPTHPIDGNTVEMYDMNGNIIIENKRLYNQNKQIASPDDLTIIDSPTRIYANLQTVPTPNINITQTLPIQEPSIIEPLNTISQSRLTTPPTNGPLQQQLLPPPPKTKRKYVRKSTTQPANNLLPFNIPTPPNNVSQPIITHVPAATATANITDNTEEPKAKRKYVKKPKSNPTTANVTSNENALPTTSLNAAETCTNTEPKEIPQGTACNSSNRAVLTSRTNEPKPQRATTVHKHNSERTQLTDGDI